MNWQPIETAPYKEVLYFLFEEGYIHSGIKTSEEWYMYKGTSYERQGFSDTYTPVGISASYSVEAYFDSDPISWAVHK